MSRVEISLNGRGYTLACEDGQEPRLRELAVYVDNRLREIVADSVGGSEAQQLMLTALLLADELFDLRTEVEALRAGRPVPPGVVRPAPEDESVISAVDTLARRIEDIALRLERA